MLSKAIIPSQYDMVDKRVFIYMQINVLCNEMVALRKLFIYHVGTL